MKYCCPRLKKAIKESSPISYDSKIREYFFYADDSYTQEIAFCPWCSEDLFVGRRAVHHKSLNAIHRWDAIPGRMLYNDSWEPATLKPEDACCEVFKGHVGTSKTVLYQKEGRLFSCFAREGIIQQIWGCPWCGKALPRELSDEWYNLLEEQFGEDFDFEEDYEKIPKEFKSDQWWRSKEPEKICDAEKRECCSLASFYFEKGIIVYDEKCDECFIAVPNSGELFDIRNCPFCGEDSWSFIS
ncbi:MAG: hypothetical protein PVJ92_02325 [Candidatus Dependentiae bacterium]